MTKGDANLIMTDSGLAVVHMHRPGAGASIMGVAVRAGSADENDSCFGLAHLVEHNIFKGTRRRSSRHIINRMEAVGGELNAYTSKEETVVYTIFPSGFAARAADLIADLVTDSVFPENELIKEREVVLDEINSYYDQPVDALYDDFEDSIFRGTPLGHNILGYPDTVEKLTAADCRSFLDRFYRPGNLVIFYCGPRSSRAVTPVIERAFSKFASRRCIDDKRLRTCSDKPHCPFSTVQGKAVHQAHVLLGVPTGGIYSTHRHATAMFSNILGGPGMNSLLNIELRERRGLVYTVESVTSNFSCGGLLTIYFGCDPEDMEKCLKLCRQTIESLADGFINERRLEAARKQYLGQLAIASENNENRIMSAARSTLFHGTPTQLADTFEALMAVSSADIAEVARKALDYSMLAFCPAD